MADLGSIGDIVFETSNYVIRTYDGYTDSEASRIGQHDVGGSSPVLEHIGPGVRAIELSVHLSETLGVDVEGDIARAQEYCRLGTLLPLTLGGKPIGGPGAKWLIESVEADRRKFRTLGQCVLADIKFALKLARTALTPTPISSVVPKKKTTRVKV